MPAKYRLSRTDFTRMRGFKRVHGTLFSLSFGAIAERALPGVACVVSAKTASKAATRNRIKRVCRAALAPLMLRLPSPSVLVFVAKKPATAATAEELRSEIASLVRKTGITP
jgi:ribonuclease P protein component